MFELFETNLNVEVQPTEFNRLLGFPRGHVLDGRSLELAQEARHWYAENGRPWIYARLIPDIKWLDGRVEIAGVQLVSHHLREQLAAAEARSVVLVAVSAGPESEARAQQHWLEEKPDEYFFTEIYGSAVVEHLVTIAAGKLCAWADEHQLAALPHYSPGYSGWDVSDQVKMWEALNRGRTRPLPGELDILSTGMLRPKKSLLGLFGLTSQLERARKLASFIPCENCALEPCRFRRAPYRTELPQIEDVRQLQGMDFANGSKYARRFVHEPKAKYSLNLRALDKWSKERLRLTLSEDGSIKASFRYEGTTCSSLGRPLAFDYVVRLAPKDERYRILEVSCAPSPGDTGYQSMCEFLRDGESLIEKIASEKPLVGQPLDEVLTWKRASTPSGCYCDLEMRTHKWGLVLEVIHFALAERGALPHSAGQAK
jgi:hypothetical protein